MWISITTLFIIIPNWKNLNCVSVSKWMSKLYYILIKKYYSAIKKMSYQITKDMNEPKKAKTKDSKKSVVQNKYLLLHSDTKNQLN